MGPYVQKSQQDQGNFDWMSNFLPSSSVHNMMGPAKAPQQQLMAPQMDSQQMQQYMGN